MFIEGSLESQTLSRKCLGPIVASGVHLAFISVTRARPPKVVAALGPLAAGFWEAEAISKVWSRSNVQGGQVPQIKLLEGLLASNFMA